MKNKYFVRKSGVNRDNELHICIVGSSYYELRIVHKLQDLLYDLIKADLVEKVGEDK